MCLNYRICLDTPCNEHGDCLSLPQLQVTSFIRCASLLLTKSARGASSSHSQTEQLTDCSRFMNSDTGILQLKLALAFNVFHVRAIYHTKTLITNKCTKRVLSSIITHSYMFRPCWVIFRENFFVTVTLRLHFTVEWECAVDRALCCFWRRIRVNGQAVKIFL
jgi:hypothetical protein